MIFQKCSQVAVVCTLYLARPYKKNPLLIKMCCSAAVCTEFAGAVQEQRVSFREEGGEEGEGEQEEGAQLEISTAGEHEGGVGGQGEGRRQEQEQEQGAGAGAQLYGLRNPGYRSRAVSRAVR